MSTDKGHYRGHASDHDLPRGSVHKHTPRKSTTRPISKALNSQKTSEAHVEIDNDSNTSDSDHNLEDEQPTSASSHTNSNTNHNTTQVFIQATPLSQPLPQSQPHSKPQPQTPPSSTSDDLSRPGGRRFTAWKLLSLFFAALFGKTTYHTCLALHQIILTTTRWLLFFTLWKIDIHTWYRILYTHIPNLHPYPWTSYMLAKLLMIPTWYAIYVVLFTWGGYGALISHMSSIWRAGDWYDKSIPNYFIRELDFLFTMAKIFRSDLFRFAFQFGQLWFVMWLGRDGGWFWTPLSWCLWHWWVLIWDASNMEPMVRESYYRQRWIPFVRRGQEGTGLDWYLEKWRTEEGARRREEEEEERKRTEQVVEIGVNGNIAGVANAVLSEEMKRRRVADEELAAWWREENERRESSDELMRVIEEERERRRKRKRRIANREVLRGQYEH